MLLYPHQKEVVASLARFKTTRGGRRAGKTVLKRETMLFKAVSKLVKLSREFPNKTVIFIAPTQKQARTIVWESFKERLGSLGEYNESRLEIKIPTESGGKATIFVGGWENRENYRGMSNVTHIEFDEVDTMKDFFMGWQEIFKPMLMETGGSAGFGGTPKKENPNLRRLEKEGEDDTEWESFHFTSLDNPDIDPEEIEKAKGSMDANTYRQEILAEYVENLGALFRYTSLVDMFSNTITKTGDKYLIVDIAGEGDDKTIFTPFDGMEAHDIEIHQGLRTDGIINRIKEIASIHQIPYSNIAVDAIGEGAGVASSPLLDGIVGFKSSYAAIKTDSNIVLLPNVHYTKEAPLTSEYKNLRSQCIFLLADAINKHDFAVRTDDSEIKTWIIEELATYQDASLGDGKRMATQKQDVKEVIGRSPDITDTFIMRMYFEVKEKMSPHTSQEMQKIVKEQSMIFAKRKHDMPINSSK